MRICLAQIKPVQGNIEQNIEIHKKYIDLAVQGNADLIFFPELSLTSYEPMLAKELACYQNDHRLDTFQNISDSQLISIAVGLPTKSALGIYISMIIFQPNRPRVLYSKQILHSDEKPYFIEGNTQAFLEIKEYKIAPAICFESLQVEHIKKAVESGADLYLASVAKPQKGIEKALDYFPLRAKQYSIPILMTNAIGNCDNFESAGQSSVWGSDGQLIDHLDNSSEGVILFETLTNRAKKMKITTAWQNL